MRTSAALVALTACLVLPPLPGVAAAPPTCDGLRATLVGTGGADVLRGTPGRDVVVGLGGNDRIAGLAGPDVLCGGAGADELLGGDGRDRLYGGLDQVEGGQTPYHRGDVLAGGRGDDLLDAGYDGRGPEGGGDTVTWWTATRGVRVHLGRGTALGQGRDRVVLTAGRVFLSPHDDALVGGPGPEEVHGLGGDDRLSTRGGADVVHPDEVEDIGDDSVRTGPGRDVVTSLGGADSVVGGDGRDTLSVTAHRPTSVAAGPGDDLVQVYAVSGDEHRVLGGDGTDRLALGTDDDLPTDLDLGRAMSFVDGEVALGGFEVFDLYGAPYDVRGTDGDDRVTAHRSVRFTALAGDDQLNGSDGDDVFDGGDGTDTFLTDPGGTNTCASVEQDPTGACASSQRSVPRPVG